MNTPREPVPFDAAARIPAPGDNVAIATRRLEAGCVVGYAGGKLTLLHTVLEGHRFVLEPISSGEALLSWGLPFGVATRDLVPGEYVCNEKILTVLAERRVDFALPSSHNFINSLESYELDERTFRPGRQVAPAAVSGTFEGYRRAGDRGVGTRNFVVVLGTTSRAASFVQAAAARLEAAADALANVDGVVAVAHTEGDGAARPNNLDFALRALAGFMVHPNVGAVLAVDYGTGAFTNETLERFMRDRGYPLDRVRHRFMRIEGDFERALDQAEAELRSWLGEVDACTRTREPLSRLKIALQCGGSDAFSGVSGNALAGWVAKELIRNGGAANLAETDELIGAEPYVLANVRDLDTARAFLNKMEVFKERVGYHGASAEGNPSGGNNYRGLYNIALKSIGAARKKDPEVRLDHVIDYAQPMTEPGYYFMDSPGNDLESIAGQVGAGCNLILFITGNGSITNFPFVPTLKFVTTTGRFRMLSNEMDVNAGRYNDGLAMEELGAETFGLALDVASGRRSKGELAGHAQVQIWRDWPQSDSRRLEALRAAPRPSGEPLGLEPLPVESGPGADFRFEALKVDGGYACDQVGLIMPTSLCSGQVARLIADRLNARDNGSRAVSRFVALVHTEGCGSVNADQLYLQTLLGHLRHPFVRAAVLLEHGCEKTHNDAVRHYLACHGVDESRFGWASVQLDGGIARVGDKVLGWFDRSLGDARFPDTEPVGMNAVRLGLTSHGPVPARVASAFAELIRAVVTGGGTVVVPENASLVAASGFVAAVLGEAAPSWRATLAYGEPAERSGLHVMEAPTANPSETLTGLGGTGVEVMLAHVGRTPFQSHPMVPLLQVSGVEGVASRHGGDLDLQLPTDAKAGEHARQLLGRIAAVAGRAYTPRLFAQGNALFQLTRGLLGVST